MQIRKYEAVKDYDYVYQSLKSEGLGRTDMRIDLDEMFVTDDGFFSYKIDHQYPRLIHFFINKDKRSLKTARKMLKVFRKMMIKRGSLFYIINVTENKPNIKKFVKYLKGIKYNKVEESSFYYIPLFGRIQKG